MPDATCSAAPTYDAAYLELALRKGHPLATLDAALSIAARAETVHLIGEGQQ